MQFANAKLTSKTLLAMRIVAVLSASGCASPNVKLQNALRGMTNEDLEAKQNDTYSRHKHNFNEVEQALKAGADPNLPNYYGIYGQRPLHVVFPSTSI